MNGPETVDLTSCDQEPIQFLGKIQPHGFLVAASRDWHIRYASSNCGDLFEKPLDEVLGTPIRQWIMPKAMHRISGMLQLVVGSKHAEQVFGIRVFDDEQRFNVSVHNAGDYRVIEFERCAGDPDLSTAAYVNTMIERLRALDSIPHIERMACRFMRNLTGFDRVMVYSFLEDGAGEVVAESVSEHEESYLGLRFPASDIPKQARELYTRNPIRVIADVDAKNVGIIGLDGTDGTELDLSLSVYRSVSEIHLQYLRNMGVAASFSSSILREDRLTGLFACHSKRPRQLSLERRAAVQMFTQLYANLRYSRTIQEEQRRLEIVFDEENGLLELLRRDGTRAQRAETLSRQLQRFITADGLVLRIHGQLVAVGDTPSRDICARILQALAKSPRKQVIISEHVPKDLPEIAAISSDIAGLVSIPIADGDGDHVVYLRKPVDQVVRWAGNPDKPAEQQGDGIALTPRQSFAEWRQNVQGKSEPFTSADRAIARRLRLFLYDVTERMRDAVSIELERMQAHQDILIEELNHRVRNIVNVVRSVVAQTATEGRSAEEYSEALRGRIDAMALAHDQLSREGRGSLSLRAMLRIEFSGFLDEPDRQRVTVEGDPIDLSDEACAVLALVVHELLTNSVKYGSLSNNDGRLSIKWSLSDDGLTFLWQEEGGPVVQQPQSRGFGRTVIERLVPYDLEGTASLDFDPEGLRFRLFVPLVHVTPGTEEVEQQPEAEAEVERQVGSVEEVARDGQVLIVEDNLLIALDYEAAARAVGFTDIRSVSTREEGLLAAEEVPAVAILDVNLAEQSSLSIAEWLRELSVPFIVVSGYGNDSIREVSGLADEVLTKPVNLQQLQLFLKKFTGAEITT